MGSRYAELRRFAEHELIFDESETKDILRFLFRFQETSIEAMVIDERVRGFAQGLLVEAIDASYALDYLEILLDTYCNPGSRMRNILIKVGYKAMHHWFKHANPRDLMKVKISEAVRVQLAASFRSDLDAFVTGIADRQNANVLHGALVWIEPSSSHDMIWS